MTSDLAEAFRDCDGFILAVRHREYLDLDTDELFETAGGSVAIIDCSGILDDEKIERYFELGCEVKGLGRGHINRIKEKVRKRKQSKDK